MNFNCNTSEGRHSLHGSPAAFHSRASALLLGVLCLLCSISVCRDSGSSDSLGLGPLPPGLFGPPPGNIDQALAGALERAGILPGATPPAPSGDQTNAAMVALGRALFFDPILSGQQNVSCATCHVPAAGTGDALSVSIGAGGTGSAAARTLGTGSMVARNAPGLFNLAGPGAARLFWDGRVARDSVTAILTTPEAGLNGAAPSLSAIAAQLTSAAAAQAMFPVTSDSEMRGQPGNEIRDAADNEAVWARLMARLVGTSNGTVGGIAGFRTLFQDAFPEVSDLDLLNFGHAARAIAAFEMGSFRPGGSVPGAFARSAFDRYVTGEIGALSLEEKRGALTFFGRRGGCARCHGGPALSDGDFHSIAAPQIGPGAGGESGEDRGRALASGNVVDNYQFRTPTLRNVELTAPYTHSGAYASLEAIVRHYGDPLTAIRSYDPSQLRADFAATADNDVARIEARIAARSPELKGPAPRFNPDEVREVVAFLRTLTDPAARAASDVVPAATTSRLPFAH